MRLVVTDDEGRMDLTAFVVVQPVMIVATAGATGAGINNPVASTAEIVFAIRAGFHMDDARGGSSKVNCTRMGGHE